MMCMMRGCTKTMETTHKSIIDYICSTYLRTHNILDEQLECERREKGETGGSFPYSFIFGGFCHAVKND